MCLKKQAADLSEISSSTQRQPEKYYNEMLVKSTLESNKKRKKSSEKLVQGLKKSNEQTKTQKKLAIYNKKTINKYKNGYCIQSDFNQAFEIMLRLQSPHPQLDPRRSYTPQSFQPGHSDYNKSIMRMLSYSLSSSLNNYHILLKKHGILKYLNVLSTHNQEKFIISYTSQKKTNNFTKQRKITIIQTNTKTKNKSKKCVYSAERQNDEPKQCLTPNLLTVSSCTEMKKPTLNIIHSKYTEDENKSGTNTKKEDDMDEEKYLAQFGQAKMPKFGITTQKITSIRENLLMRQVKSWPVKFRPAGITREPRSLLQ